MLDDPVTRSLLDFSRPVGVLVVALLHFVGDDRRPGEVLARYREAMAPGSHLVLSHASADGAPEHADEHRALYRRTATPMTMRSRDEVAGLLEGLTLVEPGDRLPPAVASRRPVRAAGEPGAVHRLRRRGSS